MRAAEIFRVGAPNSGLSRRVAKACEGDCPRIWRLYTDDFYDIPVPVPPYSEQVAMVESLEARLAILQSKSALIKERSVFCANTAPASLPTLSLGKSMCVTSLCRKSMLLMFRNGSMRR